jgi:uncharacterized membrane protein YtjA (UPF0391 family)
VWQLALLYLLLAVVAGVLAVLLRGVAQDLAGIAAAVFLGLSAVSFIAWLLDSSRDRLPSR